MSAAAWHPDPTGRHELRYWDGSQWTEHVSDAGVVSTNPVHETPVAEQAAAAEHTPEVAETPAADETPAEQSAGSESAAAEERSEGSSWASPWSGSSARAEGTAGGAGDESAHEAATAEEPTPGAAAPASEEPAAASEDAAPAEASPLDDDWLGKKSGGDPLSDPLPEQATAQPAGEAAPEPVPTSEEPTPAAASSAMPPAYQPGVEAAPAATPPAYQPAAEAAPAAFDQPAPVQPYDAGPAAQVAPAQAAPQGGGFDPALSQAVAGISGDLIDGRFGEVDTAGGPVLQNSKLLKVRMVEPFMAKQGAMVAYQGNVNFAYQGGGAGKFLKKAITGEGLSLMRVEGQGDVFLADVAHNVHILHLNQSGLSINGKNVLAFSASLDYNIERVKGGSMAAGGLFNTTLRGTGWVAITTDGDPVVLNAAEAPTFADADALVAWSVHLQTGIKSSFTAGSLIGRGSGEAFQVSFQGQGFVIVQPSEGMPAVPTT